MKTIKSTSQDNVPFQRYEDDVAVNRVSLVVVLLFASESVVVSEDVQIVVLPARESVGVHCLTRLGRIGRSSRKGCNDGNCTREFRNAIHFGLLTACSKSAGCATGSTTHLGAHIGRMVSTPPWLIKVALENWLRAASPTVYSFTSLLQQGPAACTAVIGKVHDGITLAEIDHSCLGFL